MASWPPSLVTEATANSGDGGPAASAQLNFPSAVAVDSAGNLFIADSNNDRIRKVSASGVITTVAGNGIPEYLPDSGLATRAGLNLPGGVAVDGAGNLFIADTSNDDIQTVTPTGVIATVAGATCSALYSYSGPSACLHNPSGLPWIARATSSSPIPGMA